MSDRERESIVHAIAYPTLTTPGDAFKQPSFVGNAGALGLFWQQSSQSSAVAADGCGAGLPRRTEL
jgi:hypothetical protein